MIELAADPPRVGPLDAPMLLWRPMRVGRERFDPALSGTLYPADEPERSQTPMGVIRVVADDYAMGVAS